MKEKYPLLKIQKKVLTAQLAFMSVISLAIFYSLYESKPLEVLSQQILSRGPASIPAPVELKSTETIQMDCKPSRTLQADSYQVRLESLFCEKDFQELKVINKTTGSDAIVFKRSPASFTTDYISLQKGENLIALSYKKAKQEILQEITIIRK